MLHDSCPDPKQYFIKSAELDKDRNGGADKGYGMDQEKGRQACSWHEAVELANICKTENVVISQLV